MAPHHMEAWQGHQYIVTLCALTVMLVMMLTAAASAGVVQV
jgi:hypothetical protein